MSENKILVIRGGAIGDFVLTLPVLAALRQQFPRAQIELLGYPHIAQLALSGGLTDAVRPIEARALAGFFARGGTLAPELADYFGSFAIILSYLYDPDGIFQANIARVAKAQFIAGPHRPDESAAQHAAEVFLKPLERLAIFDADPVPRLTIHQSRMASHQLALHPGSGSERKNWSEAKWAGLLQHLVAHTNFDVLLIGGEAEGERLRRLAALLPSERVSLLQNLPLTELAGRLQACAAFVGHDSGITHLAAALGLRTLALWGETAEAIWRPQGRGVTILRTPAGLGAMTVMDVVEQLEAVLTRQQLEEERL